MKPIVLVRVERSRHPLKLVTRPEINFPAGFRDVADSAGGVALQQPDFNRHVQNHSEIPVNGTCIGGRVSRNKLILPTFKGGRVNVAQPTAIPTRETLSRHLGTHGERAFTGSSLVVWNPVRAEELAETHCRVDLYGSLGEVSHIRIVGGFRVLLGLVTAPPVAHALTLGIGTEVRHEIPRAVAFVAVYVTRLGHRSPPRGQRR